MVSKINEIKEISEINIKADHDYTCNLASAMYLTLTMPMARKTQKKNEG